MKVLLYFSLYGQRWKYSLWKEKHIFIKIQKFPIYSLYNGPIRFIPEDVFQMKKCPNCNATFSKKQLFLRNNSHKLVCTNCKTELKITKLSLFMYSMFTILLWVFILKISFPLELKLTVTILYFVLSSFILQPLVCSYKIKQY